MAGYKSSISTETLLGGLDQLGKAIARLEGIVTASRPDQRVPKA